MVEGGGTLEGGKLGVFHHGCEEDEAELFDGPVETFPVGFGCPFPFGLHMNCISGIRQDGQVVGSMARRRELKGWP